jgi:hypothetical protein
VDDLLIRLGALARVLPPLLFFMASVYLGLHIAFARLVANPASQLLWFFGVVTGPLTRPVRALLPRGTPERRIRLVALGIYVVLWLGSRLLIARWGGPGTR